MHNFNSCNKQRNIASGSTCKSAVESEVTTPTEYASSGLCGDNSGSTWGLKGYPLASVFSPLQNFTEIYNCENALIRGTIFAQLDLPFVCGGMNGGAQRG